MIFLSVTLLSLSEIPHLKMTHFVLTVFHTLPPCNGKATNQVTVAISFFFKSLPEMREAHMNYKLRK